MKAFKGIVLNLNYILESLGSFKKYWSLDPISRECDLSAAWTLGILKALQMIPKCSRCWALLLWECLVTSNSSGFTHISTPRHLNLPLGLGGQRSHPRLVAPIAYDRYYHQESRTSTVQTWLAWKAFRDSTSMIFPPWGNVTQEITYPEWRRGGFRCDANYPDPPCLQDLSSNHEAQVLFLLPRCKSLCGKGFDWLPMTLIL